MYYTYILQSLKDFKYYIGVTNNICRRFNEHNLGLSKSTKSRRPFKLVHLEEYIDIKKAYKKEKYLKSLKNRKFINKIILSGRVPTEFHSVESR